MDMAKKHTYTVTTDIGIFTRTTAREYRFVLAARRDPLDTWGTLSWTSRYDLAVKERDRWARQLDVRIYDLNGRRIDSYRDIRNDECPVCSRIGHGPLCKAHARQAVEETADEVTP